MYRYNYEIFSIASQTGMLGSVVRFVVRFGLVVSVSMVRGQCWI